MPKKACELCKHFYIEHGDEIPWDDRRHCSHYKIRFDMGDQHALGINEDSGCDDFTIKQKPPPHTPTLTDIEAKAGELVKWNQMNGTTYTIHMDASEFTWSEFPNTEKVNNANRRRAWTLLTMGGDE